ncbi:cobalamin-binding protein [Undibacterium sp. Dicai25W]|uniref:cobalamin-binding protein n=1 Tax=Undibacterium sp. Dicai25W TaxID=3413034 RepID=UPI003BEFD074
MSMYQRVACLSTEAVEVMYALGAEDLVAGISGYTVRPARAREEKPKISAFSSGKAERVLAVQPDLVLAYSNMQAELCKELISTGVEVHAFNQRTIAGILRMIKTVGNLVDKQAEANALIASLQTQIDYIKAQTSDDQPRPKVYFEEWNEPLMSGIGWVSELISVAGGNDVFSDLAVHFSAKQRIIADPMEVVRRAPDIIIGSWCGKKFRPESLKEREGWRQIPAVREGYVFEIKSPDILSPGPAAIEHGLLQLRQIIGTWQKSHV